MYYFVIGADGKRYGPADIDTLVQWVHEGRIVASTRLIERGTEKQLQAEAITALAAALQQGARARNPVVVERDERTVAESPTLGQASGRASVPPPPPPSMHYAGRRQVVGAKSKVVAGLLGIFLGGLGLHRFYLGYVGVGIIQIMATVVTCGWGAIWGFVEGVLCLCGGMRDADGLELRD